jgi:alcohol dehydrogenase class IV
MSFEFATARQIIFGRGKRLQIFSALRTFGKRGLVITGKNLARAEWLRSGFEGSLDFVSISGEPTVQAVENGAEAAREYGSEFVIGLGGGSAMDAAKAIAALAVNKGAALDYMEVIGSAKPLTERPLPFVAIPTTAGTGAEVTRNAVLTSPEQQTKASLRSVNLLAALAVVDSELTVELPPALSASTGMDALTQLIEAFVCTRSNPFTDALCREAIPKAAAALPTVFTIPSDTNARDDMALASLFSGLALANAGLGAVHGFAAPIGGMFHAPHGAVCAALLPQVMRANCRALRRRSPEAPALRRFAEIATFLTGKPGASAEEGIDWIRNLCGALQIPSLSSYGISEADIPALCARSSQASSMKANPIPLTPHELETILQDSL